MFLCSLVCLQPILEATLALQFSSPRPMGGSVCLPSFACRVFRRHQKVQAAVEADVEKRVYQRQSRLDQVDVAATQNFQLTRRMLKCETITAKINKQNNC